MYHGYIFWTSPKFYFNMIALLRSMNISESRVSVIVNRNKTPPKWSAYVNETHHLIKCYKYLHFCLIFTDNKQMSIYDKFNANIVLAGAHLICFLFHVKKEFCRGLPWKSSGSFSCWQNQLVRAVLKCFLTVFL